MCCHSSSLILCQSDKFGRDFERLGNHRLGMSPTWWMEMSGTVYNILKA
jgi:hypothetical protein